MSGIFIKLLIIVVQLFKYFKGAVALAEYIAESPRLLRVDLRENEVKTGGLMALALSLKVSKSVSRVDLDRDPKRESVSTFCSNNNFQYHYTFKCFSL